MKKIILLLLSFSLFVIDVSAQNITAQDVEEAIAETYGYKPETGEEYLTLADKLVATYPLDINNQLSFTHILDVPGKTKDEIFIAVNAWFVASFNDGKSVIQMADKDAGIILAKGYLNGVGHRIGFAKSVLVGEYIVIRLDIKDEKIRLITSISEYYMETSAGVGQILFGGAVPQDVTIPIYASYPFDKKSYKSYKREAAIGYVGGIAYSHVLKNKVEKAINLGITGTEGEDW